MCKSVHNISHMLYNCELARYIWDGLHYEITMKDILLCANPENDDNPDNIQGVPKKERHFKYICKVANN